ncbi:MAG: alkaline phosphatase family protein [Anaerolineae bacterium]|nr:alkaline phosphatase family protein [Anaerolineae bacterium]
MDRHKPMRRLRGLLLWIARQAVDVFAALSGFYYSRKFAMLTSRFGRPAVQVDGTARGFIVLEIDGLSYDHLLSAVENRQMPYLAGQLRRGRLKLARWRCGLPSTTPAAQAGLLFGRNYDIPAFRWYEKESALSVVCKLPASSKLLQDRVAGRQPGILRGGSSYFNMFDGDASVSLFTLSALNRDRLFATSRGIGYFLLFLLNPFRSVKLLLLSAWEYTSDVADRMLGRLRGEHRLPFQGIFPLLRVVSNVIFREMQTFAVLMDIYRGVPSIYTTYYSYDEIAHHYGLDSRPVRRALRELDKRVRQIDRLRRARLTRDYDLIILADHGQTASEPFSQRYGRSLGQFIRACIGGGLVLQEHSGDEQHSVFQAQYLLQELQGIEAKLGEPLAHIARRVRDLVTRRVYVTEAEPAWNLMRRGDVVVKDSGSLAHVYFNVSTSRLRISEVTALFPDLVVTLASHPGIWMVVGTEGDEVLVFSREGVLSLAPDGRVRSCEGSDPLQCLREPEHARRELASLAHYPHSGDLILLGRYDPETGTVVCFEDQWASHGGLGGPQDYPFIIYPQHLPWEPEAVGNAREMYAFFARTYLRIPVEKPARIVEADSLVHVEPFG